MTVSQPRPEQVIVVSRFMHQAQSWARRNNLPFGSVIWVEPEGSDRSLLHLRGTQRLPYVELTPASGQTKVLLEVCEHYRIGGS